MSFLRNSRFLLSRSSGGKTLFFLLSALRPSMMKSLPLRAFSTELDPANKKDYDAYVQKWHKHFSTCEDDFELERGLNHIFAADWVPSVEVISEAIKASRRLNTLATAIRILDGLEQKAYKKEQYAAYISELKPLLEEFGIPQKSELGNFEVVRERKPWQF